jgi:phosphoglycolate phosphatase
MRHSARRRFRLIVFDWDGTLVDSTSLIAAALSAACSDVGVPLADPDAASHVIGLGLVDSLRHVAPTLDPSGYPALTARYRHHYRACEDQVRLFDGARELLDELRDAGFLLAVATGKTRAGLERSLAQHALADRFHATRCADEGRPKPHPDMLLHLMGLLDVPPTQTLMIGDTTHDLLLARDAGAYAVAMSCGAHPEDALKGAMPLATLDSITALAIWLRDNA